MAAHEDLIYLDNNSTGLMPEKVIQSMVNWCNKGNPAAKYTSAVDARSMIKEFKTLIARECEIDITGGLDAYKIFFTSGASESNSFIINSVIRAYTAELTKLPHIIISDLEHKSILRCLQQLESEQLCQLTILSSERSGPLFGTVLPSKLEEALRSNTCFISIVAANGEVAAINNLAELSRIARVSKIPFHTDLSQLFGRMLTNIHALGIDAFSTSFHKIGGPPGVGILVVRNRLLDGYELMAQITGDQNHEMRGGIENIPGIGAALTAYKICSKNRVAKTAQMINMKVTLRKILNDSMQCYDMSQHEPMEPVSVDGGITIPERQPWAVSSTVKKALKAADKESAPVIFWFSTDDKRVLPNTLAFCIRNRSSEKIRAEMYKHGIIIGSTPSSLAPINIHPDLLKGYVRISFSDSLENVEHIAQTLVGVLRM